jgi:hypothetical protein
MIQLNENALGLDTFLQACVRTRPLPDAVLAFLETDVVQRQYGYDLLLLSPNDVEAADGSGSNDIRNRVMLMRSNLTSFQERVDKAQSYLSVCASLGLPTPHTPLVDVVKPLNQLFKPSTKKMTMFFGSSSQVSSNTQRMSQTLTGAQTGSGRIGDMEDVLESELADDAEGPADLDNDVLIVAAADDDDEDMALSGADADVDGENADEEDTEVEEEMDIDGNLHGILRGRSSESSTEEDLKAVKSQHSVVSKLSAKTQPKRGGLIKSQNTKSKLASNSSSGASNQLPKKSSVSSMFGFMSVGSNPAPVPTENAVPSAPSRQANSLKSLSTEELALWPGQQLEELLQLLKYLQADKITHADVQAQGQHQKGYNHFQPASTNSDDYLSAYETLILSNSHKHHKPSTVTSTAAASAPISTGGSSSAHAVWLSQWRIRRTLFCTTAFIELCENLHMLRTIDLKTAKQHMTETQKLCFVLNLYNLMSVFGAIVLPWPSLSSSVGSQVGTVDAGGNSGVAARVQWQRNVKFAVGGSSSSSTCSLLQLEHCMLRTNLTTLDLPSFFMTEVRIILRVDIFCR